MLVQIGKGDEVYFWIPIILQFRLESTYGYGARRATATKFLLGDLLRYSSSRKKTC